MLSNMGVEEYGVAGAVVAALAGTVGVVFRLLMASHKKVRQGLEDRINAESKECADKIVTLREDFSGTLEKLREDYDGRIAKYQSLLDGEIERNRELVEEIKAEKEIRIKEAQQRGPLGEE